MGEQPGPSLGEMFTHLPVHQERAHEVKAYNRQQEKLREPAHSGGNLESNLQQIKNESLKKELMDSTLAFAQKLNPGTNPELLDRVHDELGIKGRGHEISMADLDNLVNGAGAENYRNYLDNTTKVVSTLNSLVEKINSDPAGSAKYMETYKKLISLTTEPDLDKLQGVMESLKDELKGIVEDEDIDKVLDSSAGVRKYLGLQTKTMSDYVDEVLTMDKRSATTDADQNPVGRPRVETSWTYGGASQDQSDGSPGTAATTPSEVTQQDSEVQAKEDGTDKPEAASQPEAVQEATGVPVEKDDKTAEGDNTTAGPMVESTVSEPQASSERPAATPEEENFARIKDEAREYYKGAGLFGPKKDALQDRYDLNRWRSQLRVLESGNSKSITIDEAMGITPTDEERIARIKQKSELKGKRIEETKLLISDVETRMAESSKKPVYEQEAGKAEEFANKLEEAATEKGSPIPDLEAAGALGIILDEIKSESQKEIRTGIQESLKAD